MPAEYGMKVWLELAVKNTKEIQKNIQEKLQNIDLEGIMGRTKAARRIQQKAGGLAEAAGMSANLGKVAAAAGAMLGVLVAIKGIANKAYQNMLRSSPYLQSMARVMNMAYMRMWRPFGDFLASLLRPLAVQLLRLSSKWLQFTRTPAGEKTTAGMFGAGAGALAGAGIGGAIGLAGGPVGVLAGAGIGAGIGAAVGGFAGLLSKIDWQALGESIKKWTDTIKERIPEIWDKFTDWMGKKLKELPGKIGDAWDRFTSYLGQKLPEWSEALGRWLGEGIRKIGEKIANFPGWLWNKMITIWQWTKDFPAWLWGKLQSVWCWGKDFGGWLWSKLKSVWTWYHNFGDWMWGKLKSIWSWNYDFGGWLWRTIKDSIKGFGSGLWDGLWNGGNAKGLNYVPEDGMYMLHKGEKVTNVSRTQRGEGGSITISPTFNITAPASTDSASLQSQLNQATRMIEFAVRRRNLI